MFTWVLGRQAASTVILVPDLLEGADSVGGRLRRDKESPLSGVTKFGRVWRKVPENDAQRVSLMVAQREKEKEKGLFSRSVFFQTIFEWVAL